MSALSYALAPSQDVLGIERICQRAGTSRAGDYRHGQLSRPREEKMRTHMGIPPLVCRNIFDGISDGTEEISLIVSRAVDPPAPANFIREPSGVLQDGRKFLTSRLPCERYPALRNTHDGISDCIGARYRNMIPSMPLIAYVLPVDGQLDWIAYNTYDKYIRITKVREVYGTSVQRADARHAQSAEVPLLLMASSDGTVGCRPAV